MDYQPDVVIEADIAGTLDALTNALPADYKLTNETVHQLTELRQVFDSQNDVKTTAKPGTIHPLDIVNELQKKVDDNTTVTVDVGSH